MSEPDLSEALIGLADSLRQLSLAIRSPPTPSASGSGDWVVVGPEPSVEPGSREAPEPSSPHHSALSSSQLTARYNSLEDCFPPLPPHCLRLCRALTGSGSSPEFRANRAWIAGQWAKQVLADRVPTPRPAPKLPSTFRPRFYVVLRCPGLECPKLFTSGKQFKEAVGVLEGSSTLCHSFPSQAEAEVYCEAAGLSLPPSQ